VVGAPNDRKDGALAPRPGAFDGHRRSAQPAAAAVITTPRDQWRGRAFCTILADRMNFGYRELMTVGQLGLCAWENGFRSSAPG
jgi:hypothetical protein